jgi:hypothetical protein
VEASNIIVYSRLNLGCLHHYVRLSADVLAGGVSTAGTEAFDPVTVMVVPLFHPRTDRWADHFAWTDGGQVLLGLTPIGRATIIALDMNAHLRRVARSDWRALGLLT